MYLHTEESASVNVYASKYDVDYETFCFSHKSFSFYAFNKVIKEGRSTNTRKRWKGLSVRSKPRAFVRILTVYFSFDIDPTALVKIDIGPQTRNAKVVIEGTGGGLEYLCTRRLRVLVLLWPGPHLPQLFNGCHHRPHQDTAFPDCRRARQRTAHRDQWHEIMRPRRGGRPDGRIAVLTLPSEAELGYVSAEINAYTTGTATITKL